MKRKTIIELIIAIVLIVVGSLILTLPVLNITNPKIIMYVMMILYGVMSLVKFLCVFKTKDYDGLLTVIASIITIGLMTFINVNEAPFKLAFVLFSWVIMMSLIKLKKSDYYHDRNNKAWILKIVTMLLFIVAGILASINLYNLDIQVIVLGFFYLIHGMLELMEPLTLYLIDKKN